MSGTVTVTDSAVQVVQVVEDVITVVSVATQGPAGPAGAPGADGPQGPAGQASQQITMEAAQTIVLHRMIVALSGKANYASAAASNHLNKVVGISVSSGNQGSNITVQLMGEIEGSGWAWDVSLPLFLGTNGNLTQTVPTYPTSLFSMVVGFPISPTKILLNPREPIILS